MDWTNKNNFLKWIVGILLVLNIVTVTIIWTHILDKEPPVPGNYNRPPDPVKLMQKELALTDIQAKLFEEKRKILFEASDRLFDEMRTLENMLKEKLFEKEYDVTLVDSITYRIGSIQTELEKLRFNHFKELISICTPEQREKFIPILKKLMERNPPGGKPGDHEFQQKWNKPGAPPFNPGD